ncbi:MAG: hypothetical protein IK008_01930 [Bacteroidales bacterium]|nr:hypothetical protein [Bacteroidales bacterium]
MEKPKYALIFKIILWVLLGLSVGVLIWDALIVGWPKSIGDEPEKVKTVDYLLWWGYAVLCMVLVSIVVVGLVIRAITAPKSLIKIGIAIFVAAGLAAVCYVLASGKPLVNYTGTAEPTPFELKITDTILNLIYVVGGAAILSIVVGEVLMAIRNKK